MDAAFVPNVTVDDPRIEPKLVPVIATAKPMEVVIGDIEVRAGVSTLNVNAFDVPPPVVTPTFADLDIRGGTVTFILVLLHEEYSVACVLPNLTYEVPRDAQRLRDRFGQLAHVRPLRDNLCPPRGPRESSASTRL